MSSVSESEDYISTFCKTLASFCNHLHLSSEALKQSIDRRPIPLDSASSTFIQCLNRRLASAGADLDVLESMSIGTVSFEELFCHCNEVHKKNQADLLQLRDRIKTSGYVTVPDIDEEDEIHAMPASLELSANIQSSGDAPDLLSHSASASVRFEEDALLDESLTFRKLGLSDASLASLASEASLSLQGPVHLNAVEKLQGTKELFQSGSNNFSVSDSRKHAVSKSHDVDLVSTVSRCPVIEVSKDDFESLPAYMKGLASWEDILAAAEKINSCLCEKTAGCNFFHQDEIHSFGLGLKARTYLLLLVRMNRLVVETIDGVISYKVL